MRILTISGDEFPPQDIEWPDWLKRQCRDADIVLYLYEPNSHYIMKGPQDLHVSDVRSRVGGGYDIMAGSKNPAVCVREARLYRTKPERAET